MGRCFALVGLVVVGLIGLAAGCFSNSEMNRATQDMKDHLLAGYDPALNLIRESPNANPHIYWLFSDNYLASLALRDAEAETSSAIQTALVSYQYSHSERWKALEGQVVSADLFAMGVTAADITEKEGKLIRTEVPDPQIHMEDWQEYADRLLMGAINASNRDDGEEGLSLFEKAQEMFDGSGLADKVFEEDGYYATYKLALYLLAADKLNIHLPERQDVESLLLSLQEKNPDSNRFGGIYTEYDGDGKPLPHTDTNTETTSLVFLALRGDR